MENIRFIACIADYIDRPKIVVGNCIYYSLDNGNRVKAWCYSSGVRAEVISKTQGHIDSIDIPFDRYFAPVRCSSNAPWWTQFIDKGKWNFEDIYPHTRPSDDDHQNIANALSLFIELFE